MKTIKNLERLQQLHELIYAENTGTPGELANKINVSERLVFNLIDQLKVFGASVCYNRKSKTYYYCDGFELKVDISVTIISNNEMKEISAGSNFLSQKNSLQGLCGEYGYFCK